MYLPLVGPGGAILRRFKGLRHQVTALHLRPDGGGGVRHGVGPEVGEGGARLSTGQKQLISFARVILADPRIFVLDEATSSIDTETEVLIQSAIRTVLKNRTSFIVAHRLSTIRSADRILVIRNGRITESGTHRELLKLKGYYYDLYTTQFTETSTASLLK